MSAPVASSARARLSCCCHKRCSTAMAMMLLSVSGAALVVTEPSRPVGRGGLDNAEEPEDEDDEDDDDQCADDPIIAHCGSLRCCPCVGPRYTSPQAHPVPVPPT